MASMNRRRDSGDVDSQDLEAEIVFDAKAAASADDDDDNTTIPDHLQHPSGRQDHLKTLLHERKKSRKARLSVLVEEIVQEEADDKKIDSKIPAGDEGEGPQPQPPATGSSLAPDAAIQELARRTQIQHTTNKATLRDKLVQVKVNGLTYWVPEQVDAPTKRTVINQSVCYFAFEFFERLTAYCRGEKSKKKGIPLSASMLFVPFTKKKVLCDVNLVFHPGQCYIVLGPPQSGKTSLLKAIAGQLPNHLRTKLSGERVAPKDKPHLEGSILYNGLPAQKEDKNGHDLVLPNLVSFVGQLDIHAPYLTVKETFDFARECRMGKFDSNKAGAGAGEPLESSGKKSTAAGASGKSKSTAANTDTRQLSSENLTIQGLGLAHVADTFVGNQEVRGVSGGQRRRVTLGEMMQGETPVACADEISTGLDAAVTYDICKSICDFAKIQKTTRIVSLLQPGPETFALFDQVVVLTEGRVAFAGPVEDSVEYFESLGYDLPARVDVADFLQAVTTPDGAAWFTSPERNSEYDSHLTPQQFAEAFLKSSHQEVIKSELEDTPPLMEWTEHGPPEKVLRKFQNSWFESVQLNFARHFTLWKRDYGYIIGKAFENVGMAVATGGILFGRAKLPDDWQSKTGRDRDEDFQEVQDAVYGALFMTCLHVLLGTSTSAPDELDQRPIHYKHGDANFYQTGALVVGRLVSTLPQRAIEICAFGIPMYWMVGLNASAESFFIYLGILLLYTFALKMTFSIIAQLVPNKANVLSFGTFLVLMCSLFSGFIVFPDANPNWLNWLYFMNPMSWTYQALLLNEFQSGKYDFSANGNAFDGDVFLEGRGFETSRDWIGWAAVFLVGLLFGSTTVLMVVLKQIRIQPRVNNAIKLMEKEKETLPEDFNFPFIPVDLTFEDLVYEVKTSKGDDMLRLLNKVTGGFWAGRMCALMGSSGAGKTTLMDVVALRKTSGTITGNIMMNGFPQERISFLRSSGYVEQFDVTQAELTIRETVLFSARLRLDPDNPMASTDEDKQRFVEFVLDMMELSDIAALPVGNYEEGGLTFEQRKRLAIAVELAASPSVLFLDEPTSGLDARGALVIMRAMKKIADTGRTVCATIHQPSSTVFEMFDDLLLLKKGGEVVFHGELGEGSCHLVDYFEAMGTKPIQHGENPAAWVLRAYTGENDDTDWKEVFEQSPHFETVQEKIAAIRESPDDTKKIEYEDVFAASFQKRTRLMDIRVHKIMMRSPSYNLARLMIGIFYAFLVGLPFLRNTESNRARSYTENDVTGIISTMFLSLMIMGVVTISMAVPVMKEMRDVFYKHRASGMLEHNSVLIAVTLGELPYLGMVSALFSIIYYVTTGLFSSADSWFFFFLFFFLNIAVYVYFGQAFICLVKDVPTAGALVGALIGFNVFFSGLIVQPQYFTGIFQLGWYTAPGRYAFEGLVVSQFVGIQYDVVAQPYSAFWWSLGCGEPDYNKTECVGTMEGYVDFFFGGRYTQDNRPLDLSVLCFCLVLARLFCWFSLKKFNYVNT